MTIMLFFLACIYAYESYLGVTAWGHYTIKNV